MSRRILLIITLAVAVTAGSATAQVLRGRFQGGQRGDQLLQRLQQRLNLDETQMNGIRALAENRRREMASLRQETSEKRQALRALMQQTNPNPTDVGNATLALREVRQRQRGIQERFMSGVKALLTPEQQNLLPKPGQFRKQRPGR